MPKHSDVVILSACRTPIGSFRGVVKDLSAIKLRAVAVPEAVGRAKIASAYVVDVLLGCVLQAAIEMNVARPTALRSGLPTDVPDRTPSRPRVSGGPARR